MSYTSMDSILSGEPSEQPNAPVTGAGGASGGQQGGQEASAQADKQAGSETLPADADKTKQASDANQDPADRKDPPEGDEPEDEEVPDDVERLKRAVHAARGDKRKARKLWQEAHSQLDKVNKQMAELQGRLAVYEQQRHVPQFQQQPAAQAPKEPPKPPVLGGWDEMLQRGPEMFGEFVQSHVDQLQQRIAAQESEMKARWQRMSAAQARVRHADYDQAISVYFDQGGALRPPPDVVARVESSDDPAEALYQHAKAVIQFRETPTIDALRAKIEAEVREKIKQETAAAKPPPAQQPNTKPPIPQSLAGARGNGSVASAGWAGPRSMEEILA